ncbi:MAG: hypothetical protein ACREIQ_08330 [Nitrospiria bacterium]
MALITISISDELAQKYAEMDPKKPTQMAITKQLDRFKDIDIQDRALIFTKEARKRVEAIYGKPLENVEEFATWLARLAAMKLDDYPLTLSDGQRKRLATEAQFWGQQDAPAGAYIAKRVKTIINNNIGV